MNLLRAIVKAADPRAWISASTRSFEMRTGEGRAALVLALQAVDGLTDLSLHVQDPTLEL